MRFQPQERLDEACGRAATGLLLHPMSAEPAPTAIAQNVRAQ